MIVLFLDTNKLSPTPEETFIWVITKTQHKWVRSELGTKALAQEVAALRCGLDAAAWDGEGAMKCAELLKIGIVDAPQIGQPLPFDTLRTHKLYDALFGQIEDVIEGKDLLVVPSGPLNKLPFQVLVTDATEPSQSGTNDFRNTAWLAKQHGITVLPSVASLKALRQFARTSRATEPFIGFGNPLLVGPDGKDNRAWDRQSCEAVMAGKPINIATRSAPGNISKYFRVLPIYQCCSKWLHFPKPQMSYAMLQS